MKFQTLHKAAAASALALLTGIGARAGGPDLKTFVMATNGQSNYSTSRQPDDVFFTFGGFGVGIPFTATIDPTILASTGISGTYRQTESTAVSLLTDSLTTSGSGNSGFGNWTFNGSTSTTVQYGQLKSESQATHNGNSDNATVNSAESFATVRDTFTPTSPTVANGTSGTMKIALTIDGSTSVTGTGGNGLLFRFGYSPNASVTNPPSTLLETSAHIYGNGYQIYGPHSSFGSFVTPPGMTLNVGPLNGAGQPSFITFGGTTTVYATVPIVYGASVDYLMGLMTWTEVGNGNGVMSSKFGHTATITGIQLLDSGGTNVSNFSIASVSGTLYDANGVHLGGTAGAPEPTTLALVVCGMAAGIVGVRRKRLLNGRM